MLHVFDAITGLALFHWKNQVQFMVVYECGQVYTWLLESFILVRDSEFAFQH